MAEETESKRSKFFSKSKWGKSSKENGSPSLGGKNDGFALSEDVNDFLKPSIEASNEKVNSVRPHLAPKIDVAVAQRFPRAHDVHNGATVPSPGLVETNPWPVKPKRRKGLTVGFVKTVPEIIGEGGDEAMEPPSEVSRNKSKFMRSVSERRPMPMDDGTQWPGTQIQGQQAPQGYAQAPPMGQGDSFQPHPVRRVHTSHYESSPAMQQKMAPPPMREPSPPRRMLGRTPTGFADQYQPTSPSEADLSPIVTHQQPSLASRVHEGSPDQDAQPLPAIRNVRNMRVNEGMALRRASAMLREEAELETGAKEQQNSGFEPPSSYYNALSEASPPQSSTAAQPPPIFGMVPPPNRLRENERSPEEPLSANDTNPFADPRYMNKPAGEPANAPVMQNPAPPPSGRQPRPAYQPSYMRASQPVAAQEPVPEPMAKSQAPQIAQTYPTQELPIRGYQPENEHVQVRGPSPYTNQSQAPPQTQHPLPLEIGQANLQREDGSHGRGMPVPKDSFSPGNHPSQKLMIPQESPPSWTPSSQHVPSAMGSQQQLYSHPSQSSGSLNNFSYPKGADSLRSPQDPNASRKASASSQNMMGQVFQSAHGSQSSLLGPGKPPSLYSARGPSPGAPPSEYFSPPRANQPQSIKSPVTSLRQDGSHRPGSADSTKSFQRFMQSPGSPMVNDPTADAALADFATRVAHMQGVFRLTAEKERPTHLCTPDAWMRSALWWYLTGKARLEDVVKRRQQGTDNSHGMLIQPHVDLAKAWWIMSDPLEPYFSVDASTLPTDSPAAHLSYSLTLLQTHLRSLTLTMTRTQMMPPHQSLIQGQDTRIWIDYPRFMPDAASVLGGSPGASPMNAMPPAALAPIAALTLGDSRDSFCYGRFPVDVSISTDDVESDRVVLPCILSMIRSKRAYQIGMIVASQSELININVDPRNNNGRGLTWRNVSWKAISSSLIVHLPHGFDLTIRLQDHDYKRLSTLVEYARGIEGNLQPLEHERLVHECRLAELQYADSSNPHSFPADKVRGCMALIFERHDEHNDGGGMRKVHRGYRMLLVTEPGHKSLSCVSNELCRRGPLFFEFLTDAAANGTTAMVIRTREDSRQCRILLVFPDMNSRQGLYDVLNGLTVGPEEAIVSKTAITGLNICAATHNDALSLRSGNPALQTLEWQKLGVTNQIYQGQVAYAASTVESESLRILARHATGCITDRINLAKGEFLFRIPSNGSPTIHMLRSPQADMTMSVDTRHSAPQAPDEIAQLLHLVQHQPTIRTLTFASKPDLHAFQLAVARYTVLFDGVASTFGISRRRMVVPIYHKWTANNARVQVVQRSPGGMGSGATTGGASITQVLVFMDDFPHADAMCFTVRSTDVFEAVKGDGKGKKWAVKLVDAKFTLPETHEKEKMDPNAEIMEGIKRKFVNLEGLDYAAEHDDITIGFETEQERDALAQSLPAAASVTRMMTFKRRI